MIKGYMLVSGGYNGDPWCTEYILCLGEGY